ncbi:hypothetical protein K438DRAFT_1864497 [Mycena galopus ATCC 62051]|nr:hypothetical protein K438DRAFT_1864497 [Mycena galopus ATCC 62051]
MDSNETEDESLSYATSLVQKVFNEVHEEFRLWKRDYASRMLQAVARPPSPQTTLLEPLNFENADLVSSEPTEKPHSPLSTVKYMEIQDSELGTTQRVPMQVFNVVDPFPAVPAHEFCTPTSRNIFLGDDPSYMPFLPFADDPTFDQARYVSEHKGFEWRRPRVDPDLEVVVVEAARRLHGEHQMLYRHIDETGVLPLELLDRDGTRGMIYRSRRRDFPPWPPGVPDSAKHLKYDADPTANTPDTALALLISTFCVNLNCNVGFCSTHLDPTTMPLTTAPLVKSHRLRDHVRTACGEDCFILKSVEENAILWSDDDTQLLCRILDSSPDTIPCDLAVLCFKPCYEVFAQREIIIPDAAIKKPKAAKKPKIIRNRSQFNDFDPSRFTPGKPCRHDGPCDATTDCACFLNKAHCERGCRCSRKCTRRWPGCACTVPKAKREATCRTVRCACYLAHRECDPEICGKCQAKDAAANVCRNADIQRMRWKQTKVAPGRWGRGLFMAEAAEADDLIIEYVGELIFEATVDSREPISEHHGRNYVFEMDSTLSIDGGYIGNDARYINHDSENPNCVPKVRMVNGEHRIGLYASRALKVGEEVLFNYGKFFFPSEDDPKDAASKDEGSKRGLVPGRPSK